MTALSVPARPEEDASLRPVPWQRMGWVTWRQHRATLAWVIVFLGALAVLMCLAGRQVHSAYAAALAACQPASSLTCPGSDHRLQWHERLPVEWLHTAGGAGADRGVRRRAGAGP